MMPGRLGALGYAASLATADAEHDRGAAECAWCGGLGTRRFICAPLAECCARKQLPHYELCDRCEGTGVSAELGVAG